MTDPNDTDITQAPTDELPETELDAVAGGLKGYTITQYAPDPYSFVESL